MVCSYTGLASDYIDSDVGVIYYEPDYSRFILLIGNLPARIKFLIC